MLVSPLLYACEPQDALRYRSRVTDSLEQQVTLSKAVWNTVRMGLSGILEANQVRDTRGGTVTVTWQAQTLRTIEAYQSWESCTESWRNARCADVFTALSAYVQLRTAELDVAITAARLEQSTLNKAETERKQTIGTVTALDVTATRLTLENDTQLALQAITRLDIAQHQAAEFGMSGNAAANTIRFHVSATPVEQMPLWKQLLRETQRQQIVIRDAKRTQGPAVEVGVDQTRSDVQLSAKASTRGPNCAFTIGYPSLYDPSSLVYAAGLTVSIRVNYPFDPAGHAEVKLGQAQEQTLLLQREQEHRMLALRVQEALLQIQADETRLTGAERQIELASQRYQVKQLQFAAGLVSKQALLDEQISYLNSQITGINAWKGYCGSVYQQLLLTDGMWEISK